MFKFLCSVQLALLSVSSPGVVELGEDNLPITGGHKGNQASTTISLEKFLMQCLYVKGTFKGTCSIVR